MRTSRQNDIDDVDKLYIRVMRCHSRTPADMYAHSLRWKIAYRVIERGDVGCDDLAILSERKVEIDHMPKHREIGTIQLKNKTGVDDCPIFATHDVGKR